MHSFYFMIFFTVSFVGGILAMGWAQRQAACLRCGFTPSDELEPAPLRRGT
jgi:hypothetical protein